MTRADGVLHSLDKALIYLASALIHRYCALIYLA